MFEEIVAAITLAACVVLLVRMLLGQGRRQRFDAAARRAWMSCRTAARRAVRWPNARREAAAAAEDAIRRARGGADRDGNVIRPRTFRRPRKPH